MAFPHPQSRKDNYRNEDIPRSMRVVWKLLKRTIDITEYRNGKDDVNPAKNRTFGGFFHSEFALFIADTARFTLAWQPVVNAELADLLDQHLYAGLIVERHRHPVRVHSPLLDPALRQAPGHL